MRLETEEQLARELARDPRSRYKTEREKWLRKKNRTHDAQMAKAIDAFQAGQQQNNPHRKKKSSTV